MVSVMYKVEVGKLTAVIERPATLPGEFCLEGQKAIPWPRRALRWCWSAKGQS